MIKIILRIDENQCCKINIVVPYFPHENFKRLCGTKGMNDVTTLCNYATFNNLNQKIL
jgi:hypothetical protein